MKKRSRCDQAGSFPGRARNITRPLKFDHGHDETHVVVLFSVAVQNIKLSPAEVDDFIRCLQESKAKLLEHKNG